MVGLEQCSDQLLFSDRDCDDIQRLDSSCFGEGNRCGYEAAMAILLSIPIVVSRTSRVTLFAYDDFILYKSS